MKPTIEIDDPPLWQYAQVIDRPRNTVVKYVIGSC